MFFNVNNMVNLCRLTSSYKFNIGRVIWDPHGMYFASIFQLSTFIRLLMDLMTHALWNKEPTRKIKLSENIWFIMEVLSIDKNATILLSTFKFNYHSVPFLQTVTYLKIVRFHFMTVSGQCFGNTAFKNIITN